MKKKEIDPKKSQPPLIVKIKIIFWQTYKSKGRENWLNKIIKWNKCKIWTKIIL